MKRSHSLKKNLPSPTSDIQIVKKINSALKKKGWLEIVASSYFYLKRNWKYIDIIKFIAAISPEPLQT